MDEFRELVKDAPEFERMEYGELVAHAYGFFAAGRKLDDENAKLRELVAEMLDNLMPEICAKAFWCRDKDWRKCNDDACGNYTFVILARELGVVCE